MPRLNTTHVFCVLAAFLLVSPGQSFVPVTLTGGLALRAAPRSNAISMSAKPQTMARRNAIQILAVAPVLGLPANLVFADEITAENLLKQWKEIGETVKKQQDDLSEDEWKRIQSMLARLSLSKSDVEALSRGLSADRSEQVTKIATTMRYQAMAADEPAQLRDADGFLKEFPSLEDSLREIASLRK